MGTDGTQENTEHLFFKLNTHMGFNLEEALIYFTALTAKSYPQSLAELIRRIY